LLPPSFSKYGLTSSLSTNYNILQDAGIPTTFANDGYALEAAEVGVALVDRSNWGRLRLSGPDRLSFLHSQSTADLVNLAPGTGADTVFVTAQGRTIDIASIYAQGSGTLAIVSPGMVNTIKERLEKYIFPNDKVAVTDITPMTAMFSLVGPESDAVMVELAAGDDIVGAPYGTHTVLGFGGKPVIAMVGGGLPGPGYTLIVEESIAADLWRVIAARGAIPMGSTAWDIARVVAGRPVPGAELTEDYNPLEAGLYGAVSLNKGCYIGQETLAKVHSQGALRRELWGLDLVAPAQVGDEAFASGWELGGVNSKDKPLGTITSYVDTVEQDHRALAYLRCRDADATRVNLEGREVVVNGVKGKIVRLAATTRVFPLGAAPEEGGASKRKQQKINDAEAEAEAARKAEKLRAMQAQLEAWKAQQGQ
jgi:tRNA-modifying protein YgfZ